MPNEGSKPSESAFDKKIQEQTAVTAFQLVWGWVEKLGYKAWEMKKVRDAMRSYAQTYLERHGMVKVLGMSKPVPLHQIYTAVRVIQRDYLGEFLDPERMHKAFKEAGRRQPMFATDKAIQGIQVANQEPFLNLLGAPGGGKSTFLRRLGLEAMLARTPGDRVDSRLRGLSSKYEHTLLPVYIELRAFRTKPIDLLGLITEEFTTCKFPMSRKFVEAALDSGQLLVLLDGLDEVPGEKLSEVIDHVRDFVDRYGEQKEIANRFVTSCRTAHYKNAFPRFTDVVLADFSDDQIRQFSKNWFASMQDKQAKAAEKFFKTLQEEANASALELARTPLLLTFLCLTFDKDQVLPPVRAALYKRALDLLLREWAAERRVHNEPVYQELNAELEIDMLAEFAEPLFRDDRFFFTRQNVTDHIRTFLNTQLNAPRTLDADKILEAIEVQQGLIVRRAQDTYSFSHLTIQEYLTAKILWHNRKQLWKDVVRYHLFDDRWAVVFELMAGMGEPDELFELMAAVCQKELNKAIAREEEFKKILHWVTTNSQFDPKIPSQEAALARIQLLSLATLQVPAFLGANDLSIPDGVETVFLLMRLREQLAKGSNSNLNPVELESFGVGSDWEGNHEQLDYLVSWFLGAQYFQGNRAAFSAAKELLVLRKSNIHAVNRVLGIPERNVKMNYSGMNRYLHGCNTIFRCKTAAYRISAETWGDVCKTIISTTASQSR